MNQTILKLRALLIEDHNRYMEYKRLAANCTDSKLWSEYMHGAKRFKRILKATCEKLRILLASGVGKGAKALHMPDEHNPLKGHYFVQTNEGLKYNQGVDNNLLYKWQDCPPNHGYYYLYKKSAGLSSLDVLI